MSDKSFIEACLSGESILDDIDDYIAQWHTNETCVELHDFLGMTVQEYAYWMKTGEDAILRDIIAARIAQLGKIAI